MVFVLAHAPQLLLTHGGHPDRLAVSEAARRRVGRVPPRRVTLPQLLEERLLRRVGARARHSVDLAAHEQVEHAPVGERPHAQVPEPGQRLLDVERLGEERPRLGEERGALPRLALLGEEARVLDGDGGLRGEERQRRQAIASEGGGDEVVLEVEEPDELVAHDGEAEDRPRAAAREVRIRGEPAGASRDVLEDHGLPREARVLDDRDGQRSAGARGVVERQRRQYPRRDRVAFEGGVGLDGELALAREEEATPASAAVLEDHLEQRPGELPELHLAGDGLGRLGHRQQVEVFARGDERGGWGGRPDVEEARVELVDLPHLPLGAPAEIAGASLAEIGVRDELAPPRPVEA